MFTAELVGVTFNGLVHARHHVGSDWVVDSYEQPVAPHLLSFDASLVAARERFVRLAAFDAAVDVLAEDAERKAHTAVHTLRGWLAVELDPARAVDGAHAALHDPAVRPRHHNPMTSAAIVDLDPATGTVNARRYGDCEVWVRRRGTAWTPVFPGDMLTAQARAVYEAAMAERPGGVSGWTVQEATLDEPEAWLNPSVGLMDVLTPEVAVIDDCEEVIVTSDGARLTPELCGRVHEWIADGIQQIPEGWPYAYSHGDLTVLHAYRA